MPKISVTIFFLLSTIISFSQITITDLQGSINTENSELNFIQINDSIAFYTKFYYNEQNLRSRISQAKKVNDIWFETDNNHYNLEEYNTGNFNYSNTAQNVFFNACNEGNNQCEIYGILNDKLINISEVYSDFFNNSYNSQPHFFVLKDQSFLAFVSDREGGFGGLDIWFSIIDSSGNFGMPINAGSKINTKNNEITPFYCSVDSKLFFSSNDTVNNFGGYDIFSSIGFPNKWAPRENMISLNGPNDEMYLTLYKKDQGYFSSNRLSDCLNQDSCCTNIYKFSKRYNNILGNIILDSPYYSNFLPLNLYFDNDQPREIDFYKDSAFDYKDTYINYFMKLDDYLLYNNDNINNFFEDSLRSNFNQLNKLLDALYENLQDNYIIDIKIRGYASQLAEDQYNIELSSLRIRSLVNYIKAYKNGLLFKYLNNQLNIIEVPLGESQSIEEDKENVLLNIYGTEAMLNRKVSIIKIDAYK
tara:strand:+ start:468 stop:1889 length:1422 start_codon:yes stop_codon:yes gene_type:complete